MKQWFIGMWPECKGFLKLMGIVYGLAWIVITGAVVINSVLPFWDTLWNVAFWMLACCVVAFIPFILSTLPVTASVLDKVIAPDVDEVEEKK